MILDPEPRQWDALQYVGSFWAEADSPPASSEEDEYDLGVFGDDYEHDEEGDGWVWQVPQDWDPSDEEVVEQDAGQPQAQQAAEEPKVEGQQEPQEDPQQAADPEARQAEPDGASDTDTATSDEDLLPGGDPQGMLLDKFTYDIDCLTCSDAVQFSFVATRDAASLLSFLMQTGRLSPLCPRCMQQARNEAAAVNTPEVPATEGDDQDGRQ